MNDKKEVKNVVIKNTQIPRPDRLNDSGNAIHNQKSFTTSHLRDKIGKPKPGGG